MEDYLACVASVDDNVGRLVGWLRDHGDLDDTMLLYESDKGSSSATTAGSTSASCTRSRSGCRFSCRTPERYPPGRRAHRHRQQRGRRPDPARGRRCPCPPADAGPVVLARRRRDPRPRPAPRRPLLPVLDARRPQPPRRRALRLAHRPVLPRLLLQRRPRRAGCSDERYPAEWEARPRRGPPASCATSPTTRRTRRCAPASNAGSGARRRRSRHAPPRPAQTGRPPLTQSGRSRLLPQQLLRRASLRRQTPVGRLATTDNDGSRCGPPGCHVLAAADSEVAVRGSYDCDMSRGPTLPLARRRTYSQVARVIAPPEADAAASGDGDPGRPRRGRAGTRVRAAGDRLARPFVAGWRRARAVPARVWVVAVVAVALIAVVATYALTRPNPTPPVTQQDIDATVKKGVEDQAKAEAAAPPAPSRTRPSSRPWSSSTPSGRWRAAASPAAGRRHRQRRRHHPHRAPRGERRRGDHRRYTDGTSSPAIITSQQPANDIATLAPRSSRRRWYRRCSAVASRSAHPCSPSDTRSVSPTRSPPASCPRSTGASPSATARRPSTSSRSTPR